MGPPFLLHIYGGAARIGPLGLPWGAYMGLHSPRSHAHADIFPLSRAQDWLLSFLFFAFSFSSLLLFSVLIPALSERSLSYIASLLICTVLTQKASRVRLYRVAICCFPIRCTGLKLKELLTMACTFDKMVDESGQGKRT